MRCVPRLTRGIWLDQRFDAADVGSVDRLIAALAACDVSGFPAIKVVLAGLALDELAGGGDFHALGNGFVRFHKWFKIFFRRSMRRCRLAV